MFTKMTDNEFCKQVHAILKQNKLKNAEIKKELEDHFSRSFSAISQRYKRCERRSIFVAHNELIAKTAKSMLRKKYCWEVLSDLGFKHEAYFYKWFRKQTGVNPGVFKQFN